MHGQLKLCVFGVLVKLDAEQCDDVSQRNALHSKQQWAKYRSLRNSDVQLNSVCLVLADLDILCTVTKVRV